MSPHSGDDETLDAAVSSRIAGVLAGVDAADLQQNEAPAGLWSGIEASIASEARRDTAGAGTVVLYSIDADDIVVDVGGDWMEFARANDAPELASVEPDRTLWSYFDGEEVRELWRILVERARSAGARASVPFRCDAPDMRRWFEMTVTPKERGRVDFRSALLFEEERPDIALLGRYNDHVPEAPPVLLCSWCDRGYDGSRWLGLDQLVLADRILEQLPVPRVSHGICAECRDRMSVESDRLLGAVDR